MAWFACLVVVLAVASRTAAADGGDCNYLNECASAGKVAMHKPFWGSGAAGYPFTSNGCGAGGLHVAVGPELTPCCDLHDACYAVCNASRAYCDNQFQACLSQRCKASGKPDCAQSARMLSTGAATFGCGAFQSAQRDACECGTRDEAATRFRETWRHLYREVVGARKPASTVDSTVEKMLAHADPPRRAYGALTKYPTELIRKEEKHGGGGDDGPSLQSLFGEL